MSKPQYNFVLGNILFIQYINAELFSAVPFKQFGNCDFFNQPESGMPLNVKDGVVLRVIEDESDFPRFVVIGFFNICQHLSEDIRRKWVKTVDGGNLVRNDKVLCLSGDKSETLFVNTPVLAQIMKCRPVKYPGQLDADGAVMKPVVGVKTQSAEATAIIQQGILLCQGDGFK